MKFFVLLTFIALTQAVPIIQDDVYNTIGKDVPLQYPSEYTDADQYKLYQPLLNYYYQLYLHNQIPYQKYLQYVQQYQYGTQVPYGKFDQDSQVMDEAKQEVYGKKITLPLLIQKIREILRKYELSATNKIAQEETFPEVENVKSKNIVKVVATTGLPASLEGVQADSRVQQELLGELQSVLEQQPFYGGYSSNVPFKGQQYYQHPGFGGSYGQSYYPNYTPFVEPYYHQY